jgi:hypothetical protein
LVWRPIFFRIRYEVSCDAEWRVREVRVALLAIEGAYVRLLNDGESHWTTPDGEPVPALDGCTDVDISVTPFTNTLPIRGWDSDPAGPPTLRLPT